MLDANDKPFLFRAIAANRCILFVGSGFSHGATNRCAQPMPLAKDLARELWTWAGLAGAYDNSELSIVYEAALAAGRPLPSLREFLESQLLAADVPAWYDIIPQIFWFRIYGTNVDDVIEQLYLRGTRDPSLEVIAAPTDEFRERDQFLRRIQYVKLHGSLPGDPRALTFGTLDYAGRANAQEDWWRHFVRDYVFHSTIFIGSDMNEPLFWQSIAARGNRGPNPEERPRSFLVTRAISPAKRAVLDSYNIVHVPATGEDFLKWLGGEFSFPSRDEVLVEIAPESAEVLRRQGTNESQRQSLTSFLTAFRRVPLPATPAIRSRAFLRGAAPTWEDIAGDLDSPREINTTVRATIDKALAQMAAPALIGILGEGGSGKSTILHRVALGLRQAGYEVFYSDGAERPNVEAVFASLKTFPNKVVLFLDNASLLGPSLLELVTVTSRLPKPPVIVLASRYIPFEQRIRDQIGYDRFEEIDVPNLTDGDIDELIKTLARHDQLGRLASMTHDERRYEFKQRSRKLLLVALREATTGPGFDEIMRSEFAELADRESRILFLCAALATASLVDLTEQQWLDCSELSPADTLRLLRRDLKGMLLTSGRGGLVTARHPVIAEYILGKVAGKEEVMEAYRRVLLSVARDIYPGAGRKHRSWRLFVRLISHTAIYDRFGEDIDHARGVYELTTHAFSNDGHFWLQYANLEVDFGKASFARPHLANAEGLLGETDMVLTTKAHMMLREALTISSYEEAEALRRDAEDILQAQMSIASDSDEYPFHVYLTHMISWIRAWSPESKKKEDLQHLLATADDACLRMSRNTKLSAVRDSIRREYLMLAVPRSS
jgi:hypothetical protein